jgi:outer membrane protein OmpA-like peptidoglycan-associated protein
VPTLRALAPLLAAAVGALAVLSARPASCEGPTGAEAPPEAGSAERPSCLGKARLRGELFEEGSAAVKPDVLPMLDVVAGAMKGPCAGKTILIEGHTEASGDPQADQRISEARAVEVKRLLVERGVPEAQLRTQGFGSSRPLSSEPALEELDRRVTFVVQGE